jgi:hypothetical protein
MKTNKLDNHIKNTLKTRTIAPAASAWERLSAQLDAQQAQKKRGLFFYMGVAVSILVLVSVGIQLFPNDTLEVPVKNEIVIQEVNTKVFNEKKEKGKKEIPLEKAIATLVIKDESQGFKRSTENKINTSVLEEESIRQELFLINTIKQEVNPIVILPEKETKIIPNDEQSFLKQELKLLSKPTIKINPQDLLYAVTHSREEVISYYEKHNVNKTMLLEIINSELKNSNLKVNPQTILAEIEKTIYDTAIENNFLKSIQKRISTLASAIASRNN